MYYYYLNSMRTYFIFILIIAAQSASFTYTPCSSSQILNIKDLSCNSCPTNQIPNPNQNIPTSCICDIGYYPATNHVCTTILTSGGNCSNTNDFFQVFAKDGSVNTLGLSGCSTCASNAYPNSNGTGCVPCGYDMKYEDGECVCNTNTFTETELGCYDPSFISGLGNLGQSDSIFYQKLKHLLPGCYYFNDYLSCSEIINQCTYSLGFSSAQCDFFNFNATFTSYLQVEDTSLYSMSAGTFTRQTTLDFKLIMFRPQGTYAGEKVLKLTDIMRCGLTNNQIQLKVGNNFYSTCTFNFDYLAQKISTFTYENYVYELFIADDAGSFFQVPVYFTGGQSPTTPYRRFFLQDTYSSATTINVLTSFKFTITLSTNGVLTNPRLDLGYTQLTIQDQAVTPQADKSQELTFQFTYSYDLTTFWSGFIPTVIVVGVLALVQAIIRTYIGYLNRGSPLSFFFYFAKFLSIWLFYFLFVISGYWFLFTKTTQDLFIFIPTEETFYIAFYVIAAVMGVFRIITVIYDKASKLGIEVFMINWEKGVFKNSWRQIFIINSLAQFYTHRTVSIFWMLLCVMFFLVGLNWQDHAAEVTSTDLTTIYTVNPQNRVLLYFLAASIFLVVGIIFKILRRLSVIAWPLPFEDFVDYCNVTNVSFFFMKKKSVQAYYIHATIPDRTEVTYKQINDAIRRGLTKNRSVANEHTFHDHLRIYNIYACKELEDRFNTMLKKLQDQQNHNQIKHAQNQKKAKHVNTREDFVEKKLKPYLQVISREGSNRTKSITESVLGFPPVDLRDSNALKTNLTILDEKMDIVSEIFPNGNEFQEFHTVIIIFLMLILLTNNVSISAFVTYFIDEYLINGWISSSCRENLQRMTKVKEGFML